MLMKVPLLDLAAQFESVAPELRAAVERALSSQEYILGPEVTALEAELASYCGAAHAIGVSNGSDALVATLLSLGIGAGDEVIVPSFTFFATAGAVARVGARPVFVDIDAATFNIDADAVASAVTADTTAIIPVHLYGQCAEMDRLLAVARRHSLAVIEDAAQAIGAKDRGRSACSLGTAGTLSFYPTKNLSGIGEGGMILTNDAQLADRLRQLRNHGQSERYFHHYIGGNFRLDGLQAAALRVKLRRLPGWTAARQEHAARYDAAFRETPVTPPAVRAGCEHVYHQYTIRSERRNALREHLTSAGIGTGLYYPLPLHLQPCFAYCGYREGQLPASEEAARQVLCLPVFPEMTPEQQDFVIERILAFRHE
jgi:dTDP-4-amino-4,6-dideoxygalactose transaminase